MSGLVTRPAPAPGGAAAPVESRPAATPFAAEPDARVSLALRLATFAALATFGASHWAMLVVDPSGGRTLLVVLVATGGATVLVLLGRAPLPRALLYGLAALVGLATLCLGLMAAGLPARLLGPANWSELIDGLDRGLAGVQGVEWPYDGPDEWIRLTILLGAPFLLSIAATVAFWPARRAAPALQAAGLVVLLLLYGAAVTENDPGRPLLRGLGLLVLVAGWLWLPRLRPREAALGAAVVVGVGVVSLPLAAALDGDRPWWDYRAWNLFGGGKVVTFDWSHRYGPLDWPRDGTTLLNVKSDRPHYWKAEVLDSFDGFRWVSSRSDDNRDLSADLPEPFGRRVGRTWNNDEYNPAWDEEIRFTVRSLSSDLLVTAGNAYYKEDVDAVLLADGSGRMFGSALDEGDSYTIRTYAPDPTARQMRGAGRDYPDEFTQYTSLYLPKPGESAIEAVGSRPGDAARSAPWVDRRRVSLPLRGEPMTGTVGAVRTLRRSAYRRVYRRALTLTAASPTAYDAVKAIERHLQAEYVYTEQVPSADVPLDNFLFEERRGYCQQFSGAMAMMLRMVGIPARVAAGFAPGSYNRDTREYRVRDLDAHSWVEVYFPGIGWVPFDPTPTIAPPESQSSGALAPSAARAGAGQVSGGERGSGGPSERSTDHGGALGDEGGASWLGRALLALVLVLVAAGALLAALRVRRRRALTPGQLVEAQIAELRRALVRLGWELPATTTLLGLERRLGRVAGPHAGAYAGTLRAFRYGPRPGTGPSERERRALRRELSARNGLRGRLRGLLAIPPGGPRP